MFSQIRVAYHWHSAKLILGGLGKAGVFAVKVGDYRRSGVWNRTHGMSEEDLRFPNIASQNRVPGKHWGFIVILSYLRISRHITHLGDSVMPLPDFERSYIASRLRYVHQPLLHNFQPRRSHVCTVTRQGYRGWLISMPDLSRDVFSPHLKIENNLLSRSY